MARKAKTTIRQESAVARRIRLKIKAGHCTWCRKFIKGAKGNRTWCGPGCVDAFKEANWPQHRRSAMQRRDRGVCAVCGIDTVAFMELVKALRHLRNEYGLCRLVSWIGKPIPARNGVRPWRPWKYRACQCVFCVAIREAADLSRWEADHIVPVIEGGGLCGLDGYRTLCVACHKKETALLARRRAESRRNIQKSRTHS